MRRVVFLIAVVCVLGSFVSSDAYSDGYSVESPSGRFRLTALSNRGGAKRNRVWFGFGYKCVDQETKETLWSMSAQEAANAKADAMFGLPGQIQISNTAWSVIVDSSDKLMTISPSGRISKPIDLVQDGISQADRDQYVGDSIHSDDDWTWNSLWYFVQDGEQQFFVIRPYWGTHMIVDTESGQLLQQTHQIAHLIKNYEFQYVLDQLKLAANSAKVELPSEKEITRAMRGASRPQYVKLVEQRKQILARKETLEDSQIVIWLAGKIGLQESVSSLRELEKSDLDSTGRSIPAFPGNNGFKIQGCYKTRQLAQLSLRRLRHKPSTLPAYEIVIREDETQSAVFTKLGHNPNRLNNEDKIRKGMGREEVLRLLGSPDSILRYSDWTYDFDEPRPHSLTLEFGLKANEFVVERVVRVTPPTWSVGCVRDEAIR